VAEYLHHRQAREDGIPELAPAAPTVVQIRGDAKQPQIAREGGAQLCQLVLAAAARQNQPAAS